MNKCINLANSTSNLYVLYIKLAQITKQVSRLILENLITVISLLFSRKGILWAQAPGFWAAEHLPPPPPPRVPASHFHTQCKIW